MLVILGKYKKVSHFKKTRENGGATSKLIILWFSTTSKGLGPLSEIFTIANLRHVASRVWACAELEFRLSRMKLCSKDMLYTMLALFFFLIFFIEFHITNFQWNNLIPDSEVLFDDKFTWLSVLKWCEIFFVFGKYSINSRLRLLNICSIKAYGLIFL